MKKEEKQLLLNNLAISIKKRRLQLNISQEKLAEKCGFDRTYISMLERAKRNPSFINLVKISKGLEIEINDLLSLEN
ncbi:transcriptional regulator [Malaciobacter halophilus]|uniref:Transcriptional regulator n=1 Tax=Malaciobacter halophilus TaxID=197482 RepID=A0A2N1J2L6_9BACT|nr:helix-turn-helix transcriptional regulator [Malaciobacter halophilus]AXH09877.1 putative restriction-modification system transcriptional control element [Malaciobacter halophilus]PKI80799.1 transcriptional regulator [Malaciobacter halophilus]